MYQQDSPSYLSGTHTSGAPQGLNQPTHTNPPRHFSDVIRMGYGAQDQVATPNGVAPPSQAPVVQPSSPSLISSGMTIVKTGLALGLSALGSGVSTGIVGAVLPKYTFQDGFKIGAYGAVIYGVTGLILSGAIKSKQQ